MKNLINLNNESGEHTHEHTLISKINPTIQKRNQWHNLMLHGLLVSQKSIDPEFVMSIKNGGNFWAREIVACHHTVLWELMAC